MGVASTSPSDHSTTYALLDHWWKGDLAGKRTLVSLCLTVCHSVEPDGFSLEYLYSDTRYLHFGAAPCLKVSIF